MCLALLPKKDGAPTAIKRIQAAADQKSENCWAPSARRQGEEFASVDFNDYCAELGVRRDLTTPYNPQENGVMARSMLKAKALPGMFWGRQSPLLSTS